MYLIFVSQRTFNKRYRSLPEIKNAHRNFIKTSARIESFNNYQQELTFTQKINNLADLDVNHRKALNGFRTSIFSKAFYDRADVTMKSDETCIPRELDWRDFDAVTEVKDQGFYCGCCWVRFLEEMKFFGLFF
jgi:C1A family cysteine protease